MDEVAPLTVMAKTIFSERVACFCLVGSIAFHVDPQLLGSVGKLALLAIRAVTFLNKILAKGGLGLGAVAPWRGFTGGTKKSLMKVIVFLPFSGGLTFDVE